MKQAIKHFSLFVIFGITYIIIELLYRGYSHWTMFILGGVCGICVGLLNEFLSWNMPIWLQACFGAKIITLLEFICGVIVNIVLKWEVWDYSNMPFNILGQVCPQFMLMWFVIAHLAIIVDDYLRYWLFKEEKPHYKLWF